MGRYNNKRGWVLKRRHGFFSRLFFTSLLILVTMIVGLIVLLKFVLMDKIYGEIRKQDEEILFKVQEQMDSNIAGMRRIALAITLNPSFTPFDLPNDIWKAMEAIRDLRNYALVSENISLIGISYKKSNYVLSNIGSFTKSAFPVFSVPPFEEMTEPENLNRGFLKYGDFVFFLFPYPSWSETAHEGLLFIQYPGDLFGDTFMQDLPKNQRFLTIRNTKSGSILFCSNPLPGTAVGRSEYISPATGFHYEIATPLSYYQAILNQFQFRLLFAIAGLFCVGFLLSFLIARYNILPLQKLAGHFGLPDSTVDFDAFENALAELNRRLNPETGEGETDLVDLIKNYTELHIGDNTLGMESIADYLGFSSGYLYRVFKQKTGTSVASWIHELRIREACRLLRSTDMPIKDIVSKIGYMDHSNFSRSFKSQIGLSPQEYRLRISQDEK